jgi:hypothetical protein
MGEAGVGEWTVGLQTKGERRGLPASRKRRAASAWRENIWRVSATYACMVWRDGNNGEIAIESAGIAMAGEKNIWRKDSQRYQH